MDPKIAFLASGRLFVKLDGREAREIESQFAKDSLDRQAQRLAIDGWKGRSGVWGSMGMAPPEWSQWQDEAEPRNRVAVRAVSRGANADELYYLLRVGDIHGLFRYDLSKDREYRQMHRDAFPADSLACHPSGFIAVSLRREDGTITLAFSRNEGRHWNDVTGGDSVDQSPSWMPDDRKCVVYQSAGVARNQHGAFLGLGPYGIESLDIPNVLSYDLCHDGGVVLTDGTGIWYRDTEGNQRSLCEPSMIESVVVLE